MTDSATLIAIDCGSTISGIVVLKGLKIAFAGNLSNDDILDKILEERSWNKQLIVLIEDIKPYSVALGQSTIDTCKFIGKLSYFCQLRKVKFELISRHQVKKVLYDQCPDVAIPLVIKKIDNRNKKNMDGKNRKPSYIYLDDRIISSILRSIWNIPEGKKNSYGLSTHSWQALGVVTAYLKSPKINFTPQNFGFKVIGI